MLHRALAVFALAFAAAACGESAAPPAPVSASAAAGEKYFGQCAICHTTAAPGARAPMNLIGPNLRGVVGRPSASLPDYSYSPAMRSADLVWDEQTLDRFLQNPQAVAPGTRMSFAGEPDGERRSAIIDYLKTQR